MSRFSNFLVVLFVLVLSSFAQAQNQEAADNMRSVALDNACEYELKLLDLFDRQDACNNAKSDAETWRELVVNANEDTGPGDALMATANSWKEQAYAYYASQPPQTCAVGNNAYANLRLEWGDEAYENQDYVAAYNYYSAASGFYSAATYYADLSYLKYIDAVDKYWDAQVAYSEEL